MRQQNSFFPDMKKEGISHSFLSLDPTSLQGNSAFENLKNARMG
jgi:hypothetical protein